jgi:hypothetical protein
MDSHRSGTRPLVTSLAVLALAACTLATWWLWLGSDRTYQVDPDTGVATGPYESAQVAGCVVTLAVLAVVGSLLLRPWWTVAAMTVTFVAAWSAQAAATDESGLWLVGAVMLAVGMVTGTAVVSVVTGALLRGRRRRRPVSGIEPDGV